MGLSVASDGSTMLDPRNAQEYARTLNEELLSFKTYRVLIEVIGGCSVVHKDWPYLEQNPRRLRSEVASEEITIGVPRDYIEVTHSALNFDAERIAREQARHASI